MFVDRRTFTVKAGRMEEALALSNAEHVRSRQRHGVTGTFRSLVGLVADFDTLVFESEWNSLAEWEKFWQDWGASPEAAAFLQKWGEVAESGTTHQLWTVVE
ncbi:MAG: hypothetical protein U0350_29525 [Caldilineaceae bacterium]